jgi:hypothetical protein
MMSPISQVWQTPVRPLRTKDANGPTPVSTGDCG